MSYSYPILDLSNQSYWNQVYEEFKEAKEITPGGAYYAIPAFEIPFLFSSNVIIVRPLSVKAKSTWRFAGVLAQKFQVGTGGTASTLPTVDADTLSLRLNRNKLVIFNNFKSDYELVFEPFYWMRDIRLTVWEYTGPEETLRNAIERIEFKVDNIADYG